MESITHSTTGVVHLIFSVLSLVFGTYILFALKGNKLHRQIGYAYTMSMIVVLFTAFMIYHLFGKFGMFHWMAVVSTLTLLGGMIPFLFGKKKEWIEIHFSFMYWSVMGLYAAFISEIFTRIPNTNWSMLFLSIGITMGVGTFYWRKNKFLWRNQFSKKTV